MMTLTLDKKPGRPAGNKRQALSHWVSSHSQFTMGQLVRGLGWCTKDADNTIRRAIDRKELTVVGRVPQPGCKRPVAVYALASAEPIHDQGSALYSWLS